MNKFFSDSSRLRGGRLGGHAAAPAKRASWPGTVRSAATGAAACGGAALSPVNPPRSGPEAADGVAERRADSSRSGAGTAEAGRATAAASMIRAEQAAPRRNAEAPSPTDRRRNCPPIRAGEIDAGWTPTCRSCRAWRPGDRRRPQERGRRASSATSGPCARRSRRRWWRPFGPTRSSRRNRRVPVEAPAGTRPASTA